ncbi:MAG: thiamine-monophosphate kinase [Candidatus Krumholzibacteriota bacterium]|nr:thiamine-monophosphate kinase [Candidatus Krumholzibacteriota bacterium]
MRESFPDAGIGDDAAVIDPPAGKLLFAADAAVENVHFNRGYSTLSQVIQKLISANVSDIFAMGGEPLRLLFTAGLAPGAGGEEIAALVEGLKIGRRVYGVEIAGGDTVLSPGGYFFNIAILGSTGGKDPLARGGAREGDRLVLGGNCGGSKAGLLLLEGLHRGGGGNRRLEQLIPRGEKGRRAVREAAAGLSLLTGREELEDICRERRLPPGTGKLLDLIKQHLVPLAVKIPERAEKGEGAQVHALIDVSDGLARDLRSLCAESETGAVIYADRLPLPPVLRERDAGEGDFLLQLALSSGEEYIPLAAVGGRDEDETPPWGTVIGKITPSGEGITWSGGDGKRAALPAGGYEHRF